MWMTVKNIDDPEYYFRLACREHARINIFFTLDMCRISNLRTTCVMIKNGHFVVSTPLEEIEREPIVWGTEASGYFTVRDDDLVHCHFRSRVARIYNGPPNSMFLVMPLPKSIDHQQRRFSRRVALHGDDGHNFQVWYGEMEEKGDRLPVMRWAALNSSGCVLGDISSSGMRVDMPCDEPLLEIIDVNDPVLLRGDFGLSGKSLPLSVIGLVRRKMHAPKDDKIVSIGCNFLKWRKLDGKDNYSWFKAEGEEGIVPIAQWIACNFRGTRA